MIAMSEHLINHEPEPKARSKRHMFMMLLCCLMPIAAIFGLSLIFPTSPYLGYLVMAICPLSMLLMHLPDLLSKKKKKENNGCH